MGAEVGRYVPADGPYGVVVTLLVLIIAVLGTIVIVLLVGKSQIPAGEIRIRILGITVRWGQKEDNENYPVKSQRSGKRRSTSSGAGDPDV